MGFSAPRTELAQDGATRPAVSAMLRNVVDHHASTLTDWFARSGQEDPAWLSVSETSQYTLLLTLAEATELGGRLGEVLGEYAEATAGMPKGPPPRWGRRALRARPSGAHPVRSLLVREGS